MVTTTVSSATFLSDTIKYLKNILQDNILDPIANVRSGSFVLTEYPRQEVSYPIITIRDVGTTQQARLGMQSEGTIIRIGVEVRIWARNVKERDELFDEVYNYLRTNQFSSDDITEANLHDFDVTSIVNVSEENVKSKVMEVRYLFLAE